MAKVCLVCGRTGARRYEVLIGLVQRPVVAYVVQVCRDDMQVFEAMLETASPETRQLALLHGLTVRRAS